MSPEQSFNVLKIQKTREISAIEEAYRKELPNNHPEDNPQGFRLLREAYEAALEYARALPEEEPDLFDDSEVGRYMRRVDETYSDIRKRIDIKAWEQLFRDEIFDSLDDEDDAVHALFSYFAEHFRVEYEVFRLLDNYFDICENREKFKEFLPVDFVNFLIRIIENTGLKASYPLKWMEGGPKADYDNFIAELLELDGTIYDEQGNEENLAKIKKLEAYKISHPMFTCMKSVIYARMGWNEEAAEEIHELLKNQEFAADNDIRSRCGEALYLCGEEKEAIELFELMNADNYHTGTSLKYLGIDALKNKDYVKACKYLNILVRGGNEEALALLDKADRGVIEQHEKTLEKEPGFIYTDMDALHFVCVSYGRTGASDKGMELLLSHSEYKEKYPHYYDTLTHYLMDKKEIAKSVELIYEWIEKEEDKEELINAKFRLGRCLSYVSRKTHDKSRSENYEKIRELYLEILEEQPENEETQLALVAAEIELDDCRVAYDKIVEHLKTNDFSYYWAVYYFRSAYEIGNCGDVVHYCRELIDRAPDFIFPYEMIAKIYSDYLLIDYNGQKNKSVETIESFYNMIKEKDLLDKPEIKIGYYIYEYITGGRKDSRKYHEIAQVFIENLDIEQIPVSEHLFICDYYRLRMEIAYDMCEDGETMREYNRMKAAQEVLEVCESVENIRLLAETQIKRNSSNALWLYERLEKRTELSYIDWLNRAEAYHWQEPWSEAVKCLDKAIELVPDYSEVYRYAARIYQLHAKERKDISAYRIALEKWEKYIEMNGTYLSWASQKIVEICFEIQDDWYKCQLYLRKLLGMSDDIIGPEDKVSYYAKMVETQIHLRNFSNALAWNNELMKYVESGAVESNQYGMERYYDMQFKILDKMYLDKKLIKTYKEAFNLMDEENVRNYLIRLRDFYYRMEKYNKAKSVLKKLKPMMKDAQFLKAELDYERKTAKTSQDLRIVADKMLDAHEKYPHFEGFLEDAEEIYLYNLGEVQQYYEKFMTRKENEIFNPDASRSLYAMKKITPMLATAWIFKDERRIEKYSNLFEQILEEQLGYDGQAIVNYMNRPSDALEYTTHLLIYYVVSGKMELAERMVTRLETLPICSLCLDRKCVEREMTLALFYDAKGDVNRALSYYEKAQTIPLCYYRMNSIKMELK